jgi:hypothetical protein
MATYVNNLRLKEIATGDESGTWGTSTNTNLELVTDGFSYGTKQFASDANETFTMPDGTADATRGFYLKFTSAGSLTATRTATLGPNTVSKVWVIENATTGSQSISIKQGSGAEITITNGSKAMVVTDGAGAGAAVFNANPTEAGAGTVTSVQMAGGSTGLTYSGGPITGSGTITTAGTLAVANGGTGATTLTANNVLLGNGTSAPLAVAPSTSGNLLTSNGSTWQSTAPSGQPDPTLTGVGVTATEGQFLVATAGSITITLPASPSAGNFVIVKDGTGAAATTSFTVGRNGSNIASSATDLTFDKNFAEITMTYINGTIGWSV